MARDSGEMKLVLAIFVLALSSMLTVASFGQGSELEPRMIPQSYPGRCRRTLPGTATPKTPGNNGFHIKISGNPDKYQPGELYTVTLQGFRAQQTVQKFIGFMLMVEPKETRNDISARPDVGSFQLFGDALSKFSEECPNAIVHTSTIPKSEIQVMWKAPPAGTGCVVFKATVQENKDSWYMDQGSLIRELCEEEQENQDEQPEIVEECCACDEAKYELTFEGVWSRHTHPKDFPTNEWLTHFSDIIGASHTGDFRMFEYGGYASEGVKQAATKGLTKKLESELKTESNKIRTIIKARGLWYPNVNGKTFAVFRVDRLHHLMSFLTMLGPSPDWIVGVSALELCLKNCSWVTEKVMNLYPWDAGVNSGVKYIDKDMPTVPQEKIRRITSSNPNTEESPFYDPSGIPMKAVAKLIVTRQRVYEKSCDEYPLITSTPLYTPDGGADRPECRVTEWTEWTPCSVTCGQGIQMRSRHYYNQQKAEMHDCVVTLVEKTHCEALCVGNISCRTTEWGEWSECSVTCGKGLRTRSRRYMDSRARKACALELMEKETCMAMKAFCEEKTTISVKKNPMRRKQKSQKQSEQGFDTKNIDPKCNVTQWSEWSPCTVTCGKGLKMRTRLYLNPAALTTCDVGIMQQAPCTADKPDCTLNPAESKEICMQPKEPGPCRGYFPRWYYDVSKTVCLQFIYGGCRGNRNNFERYTDCNRVCEVMLRGSNAVTAPLSALTHLSTSPVFPVDHKDQPVIDCVVTPWSEWAPCSHTCGNGRKERRRMIKLNPENGGKPCPKKQIQRRKCKDNLPCPDRMEDKKAVDCVLNPWSDWTACSKTCGQGGIQQRTKTVKQPPKNKGAACGPKIERKYCVLPPCTFY